MTTLAEAQAECSALARKHYENFPVGLLVPARLQPHIHAVYAFARYADDFADEGYGPDAGQDECQPRTEQERLQALHDWEGHLLEPAPRHPVFVALQHTRRELDLPLNLFTDLLSAFKQDVVRRRYETHDELVDYSRRSANPVGRLVLRIHGLVDPQWDAWADAICTALQLANFWQDVSVDLLKDRIYLPAEDRRREGVTEEDLFARRITPAYRRLLRLQVERARDLFIQGSPLARELPGLLSLEIRLTWLGGSAILDKIEALNYDTLQTRPKLTQHDAIPLLLQGWLSRRQL